LALLHSLPRYRSFAVTVQGPACSLSETVNRGRVCCLRRRARYLPRRAR
jgi:hypothetical protein